MFLSARAGWDLPIYIGSTCQPAEYPNTYHDEYRRPNTAAHRLAERTANFEERARGIERRLCRRFRPGGL